MKRKNQVFRISQPSNLNILIKKRRKRPTNLSLSLRIRLFPWLKKKGKKLKKKRVHVKLKNPLRITSLNEFLQFNLKTNLRKNQLKKVNNNRFITKIMKRRKKQSLRGQYRSWKKQFNHRKSLTNKKSFNSPTIQPKANKKANLNLSTKKFLSHRQLTKRLLQHLQKNKITIRNFKQVESKLKKWRKNINKILEVIFYKYQHKLISHITRYFKTSLTSISS